MTDLKTKRAIYAKGKCELCGDEAGYPENHHVIVGKRRGM